MTPEQETELLKYLRSIAVSFKGVKYTLEEIKITLEQEEELDEEDLEDIEGEEEPEETGEEEAEEDGTKEN